MPRRFLTLLLGASLMALAGVNAQPEEGKKAEEKKPAEAKNEAGDDKLNLTWKLDKGNPFFQRMKTTTTQNLQVMGMNVNQTNEQEFYFKWEPVEESDGKWSIKQTIEAVKMKIDIAGNPISFDSTSPNPADTALAQFFEALKGSEFTYTFDKDFKVESVEGRDAFVEKLTKANARMERLLDRILSEDAMKQMAGPTFGMVTPEPKAKGESWTPAASKLDLGPIGSFENTYTYTYAGRGTGEADKGLDKVEIDVDVKYSPPQDSKEGLPFQIKSADLKEGDSEKGELIYDPEAGRVKSSRVVVMLNGTLDLDIGGMSTKVDLKQQQTTEMETSDSSYLGTPGS